MQNLQRSHGTRMATELMHHSGYSPDDEHLAMTLDTYAQSFPEDQRQAVERLPVLGEQMGSGLALHTAQAVGA